MCILQVQSYVQYEFLHQCVVDYAKEVAEKLELEVSQSTPLLV